ncbi:MAG: VanZ family protein [Microbacterium sp.]
MLRSESVRRRWAVYGLFCYGLVVAIVLFSPVSYSGIVNRISEWLALGFGLDWFGSGWIEFSANVLMFVPLGLFLVLLIGRIGYGIVLAAVSSAGAELIQFIIPSREPALRDVLANTLGAVLGALIAALLLRRGVRPERKPVSQHPLDDALSELNGVAETDAPIEERGD